MHSSMWLHIHMYVCQYVRMLLLMLLVIKTAGQWLQYFIDFICVVHVSIYAYVYTYMQCGAVCLQLCKHVGRLFDSLSS